MLSSKPPPLDAGIHEGTVLGGKYRVEGVIGSGGVGFVVSAMHLHLGSRVAIKFLHPHLANDSEAMNRFFREARAAVALTSEHVARVLDADRLPSGKPYMVMELLSGEGLDERLRRGSIELPELLGILAEVCDALSEAHHLGITHRDLKPSNIFIARRPNGRSSAKVLDFGISKVRNDAIAGDTPDLTATSGILGTPSYMAPEQLRGDKDIGPKADSWSLGVILFRALSGELPYPAKSVYDLASLMVSGPPRSLSTLRSDLPTGLYGLVAGCLERDPHERLSLADAQRKIDALRAALDPSLVSVPEHRSAPPPPVVPETTLGSANLGQSVPAPPLHENASRRWVVGFGSAFAGTCIALIVLFYFHKHSTTASTSASSDPLEGSARPMEGPTDKPQVDTAVIKENVGRSEEAASRVEARPPPTNETTGRVKLAEPGLPASRGVLRPRVDPRARVTPPAASSVAHDTAPTHER